MDNAEFHKKIDEAMDAACASMCQQEGVEPTIPRGLELMQRKFGGRPIVLVTGAALAIVDGNDIPNLSYNDSELVDFGGGVHVPWKSVRNIAQRQENNDIAVAIITDDGAHVAHIDIKNTLAKYGD